MPAIVIHLENTQANNYVSTGGVKTTNIPYYEVPTGKRLVGKSFFNAGSNAPQLGYYPASGDQFNLGIAAVNDFPTMVIPPLTRLYTASGGQYNFSGFLEDDI